MDGKRVYVDTVRRLRSGLDAFGVLAVLDRHVDRRPVHYLRSQFAIYDFQDLANLDSPWWSYAAIDVVDAWLGNKPHARAFEWGSGASTLWLEKRAAEVISVEHDVAFAEDVRQIAAANTTLITVEAVKTPTPSIGSERAGHEGLDFSDYVHAIDTFDDDFDLICIDGRARVACLDAALSHLKSDGIIVFDNSERPRYQPAIGRSDVSVETHRSWAPALPTRSSTSIIRPALESSH